MSKNKVTRRRNVETTTTQSHTPQPKIAYRFRKRNKGQEALERYSKALTYIYREEADAIDLMITSTRAYLSKK
jgi:hypothetical protein